VFTILGKAHTLQRLV